MRKKAKGFTMIELIIVMGLTLIIMSAAYSFLSTSNKSTTKEDLKLTLQNEGNTIGNKILTIGTQASRAVSIKTDNGDIIDEKISNTNLESDGSFKLNELILEDYDGNRDVIKLQENKLTLITSGGSEQTLSENVSELKAQPLNINQLTDSEKVKMKMSEISGYKISFKLLAKKGTTEASYDMSVQVVFRNFDVETSKAKQEFNKFQSAITKTWSKSQSLIKISGETKGNILDMDMNSYNRDKGIDIISMDLKQYDGSTTYIRFNESNKTLTIGNGTTTLEEFKNIVGFKIKVIDSEIQNGTLRDVRGFKILVSLEENHIESTYETIVKFDNN